MPNESKTPETDAFIKKSKEALWEGDTRYNLKDFARQLELSRDKWRKLAEDMSKNLGIRPNNHNTLCQYDDDGHDLKTLADFLSKHPELIQ